MSDSRFVPGAKAELNSGDQLLDMQAPLASTTNDGTCPIELGGNALVACPSGILFWPAEAMLIVADLHLEKGSSFARRGQFLPPYDTLATLSALSKAIDTWHPRRVIALGDSFHDAGGAGRLPLPAQEMLRRMMTGCQWLWITGNHDPDPPEDLGGDHAMEWRENGLVFRHEPSCAESGAEIAGHLHPSARIAVRGRSIRRSCFVVTGQRTILPSFGAFTGGLNVLHEAFNGLIDRTTFHVLMRGEERLFRIGADKLR